MRDEGGLTTAEGIPIDDEPGPRIACGHCGRAIAWCSFCDERDCADPSCLACLVVALRESGSSLHRHGG